MRRSAIALAGAALAILLFSDPASAAPCTAEEQATLTLKEGDTTALELGRSDDPGSLSLEFETSCDLPTDREYQVTVRKLPHASTAPVGTLVSKGDGVAFMDIEFGPSSVSPGSYSAKAVASDDLITTSVTPISVTRQYSNFFWIAVFAVLGVVGAALVAGLRSSQGVPDYFTTKKNWAFLVLGAAASWPALLEGYFNEASFEGEFPDLAGLGVKVGVAVLALITTLSAGEAAVNRRRARG